MQPVKPKSVVQLTKPAVYEDTRKMQSNSKKRTQMQLNQMNDSSIENVQYQSMPKKCKKMQPVMQPVKKAEFRCHKYNQSASTEEKHKC